VLEQNHGCGFEGTGSAVAITPNELVTNKHVVEGARTLSIVTTSGHRIAVRSWVVSTSDDLALLRLSDPLFDHPVDVAADPTMPGNLVVVMGYPLGGPLTVGRGRVLDVTPDPSGSGQTTIQASVDTLPGNSGGPLLDTHGRLIGIVRAINLENGSAEAIPSARVSELIAGKSTRPGQPVDLSTWELDAHGYAAHTDATEGRRRLSPIGYEPVASSELTQRPDCGTVSGAPDRYSLAVLIVP